MLDVQMYMMSWMYRCADVQDAGRRRGRGGVLVWSVGRAAMAHGGVAERHAIWAARVRVRAPGYASAARWTDGPMCSVAARVLWMAPGYASAARWTDGLAAI